jgi:hypothetical protein
MSKAKPNREKHVDLVAFVKAYAFATTVAELAADFGVTHQYAVALASKLRAAGVNLPRRPVGRGRASRIKAQVAEMNAALSALAKPPKAGKAAR